MSHHDSKDIQVKEKAELETASEPTRPGRIFTPEVDIVESKQDITIIADIPGTTSDAIDVDLKDNVLKIKASVEPTEKPEEKDILVEFETGSYYREFHIPELIDQGKINAEYKDGVLRLSLPKAEKAIPRKIKVSAA